MLRRIDRIVLRVPNVASAVAHYRDVLGLTLVREHAGAASLKFPCDSTELVLHSDPDLPAEEIYYLVDDVTELYRRRDELQLKFTGPPNRTARGYRAVLHDPFGNVLQIIDRSRAKSTNEIEDVRAPGALFAGLPRKAAPKRALLIELYKHIGRTADDLPYTPHFESLYLPYIAEHQDPKPDRAEVWRHLLNIRKAGKLPKLGEAKSKPPDLNEEARLRLRAMLGANLGKRDRLPYTTKFDQLVDDFNRTLDRPLSPHLIWRLVATLAK